MTGPSEAVKNTVRIRAKAHCERCGICVADVPAAIHHRRPRGMGGSRRPSTNRPSNLVLLCDDCHREVESNRDLARESGWLLSQFVCDPSEITLHPLFGPPFRIDDQGNRRNQGVA